MIRHFLTLSDLGSDGLIRLLDASDHLQENRWTAAAPLPLAGRSIALVFEKASTRTRVSLEVAVSELGGHPVVLTAAGSQLGRGEPIADTARVLSRMCQAITVRTFKQATLEEFARHSSVPVLNALTDSGHPLQLLADLQTVRRKKGRLSGLKYAWVGDGNNMASSWIEAAGLLGLELDLACPAGYEPASAEVAAANAAGARVRVVRNPAEAATSADVINTDVWASMGQEAESSNRLEHFRGFCVDDALMKHANGDAIILHCLPAHRGEEIAASVIESPASAVWDQAEARLHTAKALLLWALEQP